MKRLFQLLLILFVVALVFQTIDAQATYYTTSNGARLRSEPNTTGAILAQIPGGTAVSVLESVQGSVVNGSTTWYKVSVNSQTGYIHSSLLTQALPATVTQASPTVGETPVHLDYPGKLLFSYSGQEAGLYLADSDGKNVRLLVDNMFNGVIFGGNAPSWSPDSSHLAFASVKDGNPEIYTVDIESGELTRLTNNLALDGSPTWSPDGKQILFMSDRTGDYQGQYLMNSDGSNQRALTFTYPNIGVVAGVWGPEGKYILVQGPVIGASRDGLYKANLNSSNLQILTSNYNFLNSKVAVSPDGLQLAYSASNNQITLTGFDIYVADIDGDHSHVLTGEPTDDLAPTWSPEGTKILFTSENGYDNSRIYIMDADGSNKELFTQSEHHSDAYPSWSPDGQTVAFIGSNQIFGSYTLASSDSKPIEIPISEDPTNRKRSPDATQVVYSQVNADNLDIYISDSDGSNPKQVGTIESSIGLDDIAWSPDGATIIAISRTSSYTRTLYIINVLYDKLQQLPQGQSVGSNFDWSPDSQSIAFTTVTGSGEQIAVYDLQKLRPTFFLTPLQSGDYANTPRWSPDGKQMVFSYTPSGNSDIYVMNADGSNQRQLTQSAGKDENAFWSPDGSYVAFMSDRNGNEEIYVMRADGTEQTRATNSTGREFLRGWLP